MSERGFALPLALLMMAAATVLTLLVIERSQLSMRYRDGSVIGEGDDLLLETSLLTGTSWPLRALPPMGTCSAGYCNQNNGSSARALTLQQYWDLGVNISSWGPNTRLVVEYLGIDGSTRWYRVVGVRKLNDEFAGRYVLLRRTNVFTFMESLELGQ